MKWFSLALMTLVASEVFAAAPCEFSIQFHRPLNFTVEMKKTKKCQNVDEESVLAEVKRRVERKLSEDKIQGEKAYVFLRLEMLPDVVDDLKARLQSHALWSSKKGQAIKTSSPALVESELLKGLLVQKVATWGWTLEDVRIDGMNVLPVRKGKNAPKYPRAGRLSLKIDAFTPPTTTTTTMAPTTTLPVTSTTVQ